MAASSRKSPTRSVRREKTRTSILDAAERVFGDQGLEKTTMGDIATAARASRPLLYRYFRDKEALFEAVVERVLREWHEVLTAEATRATPGTAHTIRLVLIASLDFARERDVLRGLLGRDSRLALAGYSDVIDRGSSLLRALITEILKGGVLRGDVRSDLNIEDLAHVVSEVFLAYADHIVSGEIDGLGERRIEAILETLLHGFIAMPVPSVTPASPGTPVPAVTSVPAVPVPPVKPVPPARRSSSRRKSPSTSNRGRRS